jgi:hypothetical protein
MSCRGEVYSCAQQALTRITWTVQRTRQEHSELAGQADEAVESVENPGWCIAKAVGFLLLGAAIAAAFADPLVDAVHNFSDATHIPSFFISFIALPLATNSSEAVSAIIFTSRKKQRTCSLTFSEVRTPPLNTAALFHSRVRAEQTVDGYLVHSEGKYTLVARSDG